jgi:hypothetical protein
MNSETGNPVIVEELLNGAETSYQIVQRISDLLYGGEMSVQDRRLLVDYLEPNPPRLDRIREAFALALAAPGYQWY